MLTTLTPFLATTLTALVLIAATQVRARPVVIGLSPSIEATEQNSVIRDVATYLAETVAPGETAHVIDAQSLKLIGTFTVPEGTAYQSPRAKLKANRPLLRALKTFADGSVLDESLPGRMDLPGLLRHVGRTFPASGPADLIVIGTPLHDDPRVPAFSMADGNVPNDGHITVGRDRSPYGVKGEVDRLAGYRVFFGAPGNWAATDRHAHYVERFWALNIAARGGTLASFTGDLTTLLMQAATGSASVENSMGTHVLAPTDKLEMVRFLPTQIGTTTIYDRAVTETPPDAQLVRRAGAVELGIAWDCTACDLDLYARPGLQSPTIFFGNKETADGRLFKDFRRSPAISNGFETIAFTAPVDLSKLTIGVNFFLGRVDSSEIRGEIRIAIGEETWAAPFVIPARHGNLGGGRDAAIRDGRAPNAHWVMIDPMKVVGLR
ncbi:MAG: hypothetical protein AAGI03_06210 [Pseudomonadota bacterium]